MNYLKAAYRFRPLRTAAQALVPLLAGNSILHLNLAAVGGVALSAGVLCFTQILAEGGDMLADDKHVTDTKVA